jgi:hypothetical protein
LPKFRLYLSPSYTRHKISISSYNLSYAWCHESVALVSMVLHKPKVVGTESLERS